MPNEDRESFLPQAAKSIEIPSEPLAGSAPVVVEGRTDVKFAFVSLATIYYIDTSIKPRISACSFSVWMDPPSMATHPYGRWSRSISFHMLFAAVAGLIANSVCTLSLKKEIFVTIGLHSASGGQVIKTVSDT